MPAPGAAESDQLRRDLAGDAAQQTIAEITRLDGVALRIRLAGAPVCAPHLSLILGAALGREHPSIHDVAYDEALGLAHSATVVTVLADTPADRAGLRAGDVILAVNGRAVAKPWQVYEELRKRREATDLRIRRGAEPATIRLEPVVGCGFEVEYVPDPSLATGRALHGHAFVTAGFVRFVRSDDELAIVISHELAHRILDDETRAGFLEHELDADRIGLYLAARAGYDVAVAPDLWERVAIEKPWMIRFEPGPMSDELEPIHARIGKRVPALRRLVAEIRDKQARGGDLVP